MIIIINVTKTYLPDINKYKKYVEHIFESGWITNNGKLVQELEIKLKEYLGVRNILLVSNGTIALQVAYKLLELKGDVITTPFSFVATTSSLVWEGLKPVFVDIDKHNLNIDTSKIEDSISDNTCAILPVHVFGNVCDVEKIKEIAKKYDLKVIYDAAHAFGVKYKNKSILNYGDVSVISFHATKIFHTIEGGALVINDDKLYEKAKKMINFGITGPETIEGLGINAKMNEFQAAMGLCVLEDIDCQISKRKAIYDKYKRELSHKLQFQKIRNQIDYNYSYFSIGFETEDILYKVLQKLNSKNIFPRRYFYPSLNNLNYLKNSQVCSASEDISKRILCLPLYHQLKVEEQDSIIEIINSTIYESI
ncbi:DegT/DnrJ/EryC1/StrS family aminotransferase [Tepidibacter sp. Z1-5]|uniref:DegT/DnrJ/EryC1/StrS family aminotransferase n=1 Tax=Tepidibacter sp. Z1-5 TaxID=3134138 RepID=UPI0030BB8F38